jgi:hypothetical protein
MRSKTKKAFRPSRPINWTTMMVLLHYGEVVGRSHSHSPSLGKYGDLSSQMWQYPRQPVSMVAPGQETRGHIGGRVWRFDLSMCRQPCLCAPFALPTLIRLQPELVTNGRPSPSLGKHRPFPSNLLLYSVNIGHLRVNLHHFGKHCSVIKFMTSGWSY